MTNDEGKLFLIRHGLLGQRALRQTRKRNYIRTAECWWRHMEKVEDDKQRRDRHQAEFDLMVISHEHRVTLWKQIDPSIELRWEQLASKPEQLTLDEFHEMQRVGQLRMSPPWQEGTQS